jgi:hypothetical protein
MPACSPPPFIGPFMLGPSNTRFPMNENDYVDFHPRPVVQPYIIRPAVAFHAVLTPPPPDPSLPPLVAGPHFSRSDVVIITTTWCGAVRCGAASTALLLDLAAARPDGSYHSLGVLGRGAHSSVCLFDIVGDGEAALTIPHPRKSATCRQAVVGQVLRGRLHGLRGRLAFIPRSPPLPSPPLPSLDRSRRSPPPPPSRRSPGRPPAALPAPWPSSWHRRSTTCPSPPATRRGVTATTSAAVPGC